MDEDKLEDDFGGFETADPIECVEAKASHSLEAKPSPWVSFLPAHTSGSGDSVWLPSSVTSAAATSNTATGFDFDKAFGSLDTMAPPAAYAGIAATDFKNSTACMAPSSGEQLGDSTTVEGTDMKITVETPSRQETEDSDDHEKQLLIKEMEKLRQRDERLSIQLENTSKELTQQREQYDALQMRHKAELEELRQAGHTTLTAIVDEYKALSAQVLLEVRQTAEKELQETLQQQQEHISTVLQAHEDKLERHLLEKDKQMKAEIQQLKVDLHREQQENIEAAISVEHDRGLDALKVAVQELTESYDTKMSVAQQQTKEKISEELRQQRKELLQLLADEKESGAICRKQALETERNLAQEHLDAVLKSERQNQVEARNEILENAREETKRYLQEQRQADQRVMKKSLASIDLFLQGASKQLQLLLTQSDTEDSGDS